MRRKYLDFTLVALITALLTAPAAAQEPTPPAVEETEADERVVTVYAERSNDLVGTADSASQGTVGARQLHARPVLRPAELLEAVPGVIISQHSGSGKANQYFLRGFNLDHGTDLGVWLDGMPVNMPTHGHGQGYTDLNFLIPELVANIDYRKGAYRADQGDFSSAGTVAISYANRLRRDTPLPQVAEVSFGNFGQRRFLWAGSPPVKSGDLVTALELSHYDGPWENPEHFRKINGVLRYTRGDIDNGWSLTGMAYDAKWNSTDQVPVRAINSGALGRFGAIDPTDGGKTHRYSLSGQWQRKDDNVRTAANAYLIDYKLNLFSNFTYFLDHPETDPAGQQGDQFEQADDRLVAGLRASRDIRADWGGRPVTNSFGLQVRHDRIRPVGLYNTDDRNRFNTVRQDRVTETSYAPYIENQIAWTPRLRSTAGLRYDNYHFKVNSSIAANSGNVSDSIVSPKLGLAFGPYDKTDIYFNVARGFHSNDARGTTIRIDPNTGLAATPVTPLVRSNMAEIGLRTARWRNLQSTLSLWHLKLDSELLFVGDAGTTEASRPSRRTGIEFTNFYTPNRSLTIDADIAFSKARFTDVDPAGNRIPGAIEGVVSIGATVVHPRGYFAGLRLRYFGPRPLIEDNTVRSKSSTLVNGKVGCRLKSGYRVGVELYNIFNSSVSDIDYYYTSRLPGEAAGGADDIHTHPAESRSIRLVVAREF